MTTSFFRKFVSSFFRFNGPAHNMYQVGTMIVGASYGVLNNRSLLHLLKEEKEKEDMLKWKHPCKTMKTVTEMTSVIIDTVMFSVAGLMFGFLSYPFVPLYIPCGMYYSYKKEKE
jgi:hypothetical protein